MNKQLTLLFIACICLGACQTYEQVAIDYMVPAKITFPNEFRSVAVINNVTTTANDSANFIPADAKVATQELAETLALTNYFDEVVICDSALRQHDTAYRESFLTQQEVIDLTKELDVDFLISLEDMALKLEKANHYHPDWNAHQAVADMKVYSLVNVYSGRRTEPILKYVAQDSIFWESFGGTPENASASLPSRKVMSKEGSEFAGSIPVAYLIPHWKSANRTLFNNGSIQMRDAAFHVKSNNWDDAFELWTKEYQSSKSKKRKMYCANNIAVYYEMSDNIEKSLEWANKAKELATEIYGTEEKAQRIGGFTEIPYIYYFQIYSTELERRNVNLSSLRLQMQRHRDDF